MAASNYEKRGAGTFASYGVLGAGVAPLADTLTLSALVLAEGDTADVGDAVMIDDEICKITEIGSGYVKAERGCADTIPASHSTGALVWFFEANVGTDLREYAGTETIGVKVLPYTSGEPLSIEASPPNALTFGFRFIRPYPPGQMMVNGAPWNTAVVLHPSGTTTLSLSWAHRNRLTQADVLIGYGAGGVTPEAGTTHRLRVFSPANTLLATHDMGAGTSHNYTRAQSITDTASLPLDGSGYRAAYLLVNSLRDGFMSLQSYRIDFSVFVGLLRSLLLEDGDRVLLESGDRLLLELED